MNSFRKSFVIGRLFVLMGCASLLWLIASASAEDFGPRTSVKLLTVGNSFAVNSTTYLPDLAKAGGKTLVLLNCYKGGCTLEEHAKAIEATERNPQSPEARIYIPRNSLAEPEDRSHPFNLKEALLRDKWDVITVQQASPFSYSQGTYEPYAGQVIGTIRKYAPQAEIRVHETWGYREDDALFQKGDFTPRQMYIGLKVAYEKLAVAYHLRLIPVGDAFQIARQSELWHFVPDTTFDFANAKDGTMPNQKGSLNMGWSWQTDGRTGKRGLVLDAHHANVAGQYLGAAVFYEALFQDNVTRVNFCPKELTPEEAADLRRIAHVTVQSENQNAVPR